MFVVSVLIALVMMLLAGKLFGDLVKRMGFTPLIGHMVAGILLGPTCLNLVTSSGQKDLELLYGVAILFMMFTMGLSIDFERIMGEYLYRASIITLLNGVGTFVVTMAVTLLLGFDLYASLLVGVALISSSTAIAFLVMHGIGDSYSRVFKTIMAAGIADDILAMIALSLFLSYISSGVDFVSTFKLFLLVVGFIIFALGFGKLITERMIGYCKRSKDEQSIVSFSIILLFMFATVSDIIGIGLVTGAFFAGTILARSPLSFKVIAPKIDGLRESLFAPVFFVYTGMRIDIFEIFKSAPIDLFIVKVPIGLILLPGLVLAVIACKYSMTYVGAWLSGGYRDDERHKISMAMMPMGDYTLVIGGLGMSMGILDTSVFSALAMTVLALSIVTPVMLRKAYN